VVRRASPVRTCVGCRSRAPSSELLRVVAVGEVAEDGARARLEADPRHRLPGRGAHIHPDLTCLAKAERRKAFGRALRLTGVLDTGPLSRHLNDLRQTDTPMVGASHPGYAR
jgi:uncharacterized protein